MTDDSDDIGIPATLLLGEGSHSTGQLDAVRVIVTQRASTIGAVLDP